MIIRCLLGALSLSILALVTGTFWSETALEIELVGRAVAAELAPPGDRRTHLTVMQMLSPDHAPEKPVHFGYFQPVGAHGAAHHGVSGLVRLPAFAVKQRRVGSRVIHTSIFPGFAVAFLSSGAALIPVVRDILITEAGSGYNIILGIGRIWSEPGDSDWSRASFPFTLVEPVWGGARNGAATFLYKEREASPIYIQVGQESIPGSAIDLWGSGDLEYLPGSVPNRATVEAVYQTQKATAIRIEPWSALATRNDPEKLEPFDGVAGRANITVSGLVVDDIAYVRGCRTRFGRYPFCAEMRHMVWSVTKSLAGFLTLARLAQKYGDEVLDERIIAHVPLAPDHEGWDKVTFRDTINMATGIGTIMPRKVSHYVEVDDSGLSMAMGRARFIEEMLRLISSEGSYPWGPGEVMRYRSTDSTVLAYAMDSYLKGKEGPQVRLWGMMREEVLAPLGISVLPVRHIRSSTGGTDIPAFGYGMYPTIGDTVKLARLLQNGGKHDAKQILHEALVTDALEMTRRKGLPTGWTYKDGTESYYHLSFWRAQFRASDGCTVNVPLMSGHGGNYIVLMPKGTIGFRFADNPDRLESTWDSSHIRQVADHVKPFCG